MIQMFNRHDTDVSVGSDGLHVEIIEDRKEMGLVEDMRKIEPSLLSSLQLYLFLPSKHVYTLPSALRLLSEGYYFNWQFCICFFL